MGDRDRTWTVWLHRDGGADSRSFRLDPRFGAAAALGVLLLAAAGGAAFGLWAGRRAESERVRRLQERVRELDVRRDRVVALAARLDSVESVYRRVREVLGAGTGDSAWLPASAAGGDVPPSTGEAERLPRGWPLARPGFVTRRFRSTAEAAGHPGLDVAVPSGSYVRAVRPGGVLEVGRDSLYGRFLTLRHDGGYRSLYGHTSRVFVRPGDTVARGQVIALSGNSGRSTAPHLHVEVTRDGRAVDPLRFLRAAGAGSDGRDGGGAADVGTAGTRPRPGPQASNPAGEWIDVR